MYKSQTSYLLIGLTCLLGLATGEVCLYKPYITGIRNLNVTLDKHLASRNKTKYAQRFYNDKLYNVSMELELDYTTLMTVSNLTVQFSPGNPVVSKNDKFKITYKGKQKPSDFIYAGLIKPDLKQTKTKYLERLNEFYNINKLASKPSPALGMIKVCQVKIFNTMVKKKEEYYGYLDSSKCVVKQNLTGWSELTQDIVKNIVSAAYADPLTFEMTADGDIYVEGIEPVNDLLVSQFCKKELKNLITVHLTDPSAIEDYHRSKPFRSITKLTQNTYLTLDQSTRKNILNLTSWTRSNFSDPYVKGNNQYQQFSKNPQLINWTLEAISSLPYLNNSQAHLIFRYQWNETIAYFRNVSLEQVNLLKMSTSDRAEYPVPDDITHWTCCKKIVSVYGWLYTLHNYNQHIFKDSSNWFIFDANWFDHKIQAIHAEADEFMFFTKATTVIVMRANSRNCNRLELSNKRVMHVRQLFNYLPKQIYIEGRYFENSVWLPQFSSVPWTKRDLTTLNPTCSSMETSLTWLYVLIGIFSTFSVAIILLVIILRRSSVEKTVIYSRRSKSPNTVTVRSALKSKSSLPLFSQLKSVVSPKKSRRKKSASPAR